MSHKAKGKTAFLNYYSKWFNAHDLDELLTWKNQPIIRILNQFEDRVLALWKTQNLNWEKLSWFPSAYTWPYPIKPGEKIPGFDEGYLYVMNESSLAPIKALQLQGNEVVLDACAAPGGKTLAILDLLKTGTLIANDLSSKRSRQLTTTLNKYHRDSVLVLNLPAEVIHYEYPEYFDAILLDAPCSSEKHLFNSPKQMSQWSTNRINKLKKRQYRLIIQLLKCLKPNGKLIYSTCAINPDENEGVVSKVMGNLSKAIELVNLDWQNAPGSSGISLDNIYNHSDVRRILPNKQGLDPMFVACFRKK